jgi:hypothetical protein
MRRQIDSAESTTNSATSSAADPVTTNTFQQPADAVTFSSTPASQWASCKQDNQKIRPRDALQTARGVTEPTAVISSDYECRTHLPIICLVFSIKRQLADRPASFLSIMHIMA